MSVKAISWAFEAKVGNSNAKLVLLALADHANDKHECWPGADLVASKTELSRRTVFRCALFLIENGFITRINRTYPDGGSRTPLYLLNVETSQGVVSNRQGGVSNRHRGVSPLTQGCATVGTTYEPTLEPPLEPKIDSLEKSGEKTGSKEESGLPKKRKPRHGQRTKDGKRLWLDIGTMEWEAYADDHRKAHNGLDPLIQWNNSGSWFNLVGETGKGH